MSETDVLRALVEGRLAMCAAPGCSHTFEPGRGRFCRQLDCTRNTVECAGPWCANRVAVEGDRRKRVTCSDDCAALLAQARDRALFAHGFERTLTVREAIESMESMGGANLGERFQAVQEAVKTRDGATLYNALVAAGAACLETAARRGPR